MDAVDSGISARPVPREAPPGRRTLAVIDAWKNSP